MAVAYDATGAGGTAHSTSGVSWSHTIGASATLLIVGVGGYYNSSTGYASLTTHTCTVGGASLTLLGIMNCNNVAGFGWIELWGKALPPHGAQTITVVENVSTSACYLYGNSVSYTGATSFGTAVLNSGASTALTSGSVVSTLGSMVVSAQGGYDQTLTVTSGTSRYNQPTSRITNYVNLSISDVVVPAISGAVTFDAVGSGGNANNQTGSPRTVSGTHTATAGAYVVVSVNALTDGNTISTPTCTYGGVSMTLLGSEAPGSGGGGSGIVVLFGLASVAGGLQTVTASVATTGGFSGNNVYALTLASVSYKNVVSVGVLTVNDNTGTAMSVTATGVLGGVAVAALGTIGSTQTLSAFGGATQRYLHSNTGTRDAGLVMGDTATIGALSITATTSVSSAWGGVAVQLLNSVAPLTSTAGGTADWAAVSVDIISGIQWIGGSVLALSVNTQGSDFSLYFPFVFGGGSGPRGNVAWIGGAHLALTANVLASASNVFPMFFPFVFGGTGPSGARLILGAPLRYVGRYPQSDANIVSASYAQAANAQTAVTLNYIDSQVAVAAANLVSQAWINQQVANYATQGQVSAALAAYIPNTALDTASGIAQLGPDEEIVADELPALTTNSLAVSIDAVATGTVYLTGTFTVSSTALGAYLIASVDIPDPGYPWIPWPFAYVQGYAGGAASASRLSGNGNSGLLTVTLPITTGTPVVYGAGLMTDDTLPNYYQCVPFGSSTGSMTPLTQPPIVGPMTLQLSASCWTGNAYTVSATGLVFYIVCLPAQGG